MIKQALKGELAAIHEFFNRSTRELAEADSNYTPKDGMFTTAAQIAHVAQTIEWFVDGAYAPAGFSMEFEAMDKEVRACKSIQSARAWFEKAVAHAHEVIDKHSDEEWSSPLPPGPIMGGKPRSAILAAINDHTAHHRGALTVYTRLLGKVPPMPYMDM
jgi:uncharacterized damage-inducible protein DinB